MFCPKCGSQNADSATECGQCGYPMQPQAAPRPQADPGFYSSQSQASGPTPQPMPAGGGQPPVASHLVWAILTTLFCCLPFGVVSIIYAAQVSGKQQSGDYGGALASARKARVWAWVAFGSGLFFYVIFFGLGVLGVILEQSGY